MVDCRTVIRRCLIRGSEQSSAVPPPPLEGRPALCATGRPMGPQSTDQPGISLIRDLRRLTRPGIVVKRRCHAETHGAARAAQYRLMGHPHRFPLGVG